MVRLLVFLGVLLAFLLALPGAHQDLKADCPSAPLPIAIKSPGCFRLTGDYTIQDAGQWAINVESPNVLVDLDGHTINGPGPTSTASGIYAAESPGIVLRGGTIKGFLFGARVENTSGSIEVRDMAFSGGARGIVMRGDAVLAVRNSFSNMQGYSGWPAAHTIAIETFSTTCRIEQNSISEIYPFSTGEIVAISLSAPVEDCVVTGNRIVNSDRPEVAGRGIAFWLDGTQRPGGARISDNIVEGYDYAFMSAEQARSAFVSNRFVVTCLPGEVTTYSGGLHNDFLRFGSECRDTLPYLRRMASKGDPEWSIRLAVAMMEFQDGVPDDAVRCERLRESMHLLTPLMSMPQAQEQMRRVESINARCPEP